ncbi:phage tail fiber protein [Micromonospora aurantiaca (nom. illeg.)]|uniref:phage tail fiber protein n=1 Tax=Micromonospora aurantiaca (nom. illeg.) TaxID=47850 RepID=UPI0033D0CD5F
MATGLSTTNLANAWLSTMRGGGSGTNFTAPAALYAQAHSADPGASGTTGVSTGVATRQAMAFGAPSGGSMSLSTAPSWTATGSDTITHVSIWSATSAGTFYASAALTASRTVANGDTLSLATMTFSLSPLAA